MTREELIRALSNRAQNLLREGGMQSQSEHLMYMDAYMMLENDATIIKNLTEIIATKTASSDLRDRDVRAKVMGVIERWMDAREKLRDSEIELGALYETMLKEWSGR